MPTTSHATMSHEALPKFTGDLADLTAFTEANLPKPGDLVVCLDASGGHGKAPGETCRAAYVDGRGFHAFLNLEDGPGAFAFRFAPFPQESTETPRAFQVGDLVVRNTVGRSRWWTPGKAYEVLGVSPDGELEVADDDGDVYYRAPEFFDPGTPATAKPAAEPTRASVTFLPGIGKLTPTEELAVDVLKAADAICEAFSWADTAEGWNFWDAVSDRLLAYARDLRAAIPAPAPEPLDMRGLSAEPLRHCGVVRLSIGFGEPSGRALSPAAARALAEQLVANAEAVERAAR